MSRVTVVGDCLLARGADDDVNGADERAGVGGRLTRGQPAGAGLSAVLAANDGHEVTLVTALAGDPGGWQLRELLERARVEIVDLGLEGATHEQRAGASPLERANGGAPAMAARIGPWRAAADEALADAEAVLVSCHGRGMSALPAARRALEAVAVPLVWDPHPHGETPVFNTAVATPNNDLVRRLIPEPSGEETDAVAERATALLRHWDVAGIAVIRGEQGAVFTCGDGEPFFAPAPLRWVGDARGAGDRFAATVVAELAAGGRRPRAITAGIQAASRFVAAGGAAAMRIGPDQTETSDDAFAVAARIRASGGTIVATAGCFDLVEVGVVEALEAARELGDCLVVCVNADASVQRLKGPGRPVVPERERAAVLRALDSVDAVVVFDEDTPSDVLRRLRPDVVATGGEQLRGVRSTGADEADWGGRVIELPQLADTAAVVELPQELTPRGY